MDVRVKCRKCGETLHQVPGGEGPVWVNPSGFAACLAGQDGPGPHVPLCGHRWYEAPQPGEEPNAGPEHPTLVVRTCTLEKDHWPNPVDHHDVRSAATTRDLRP